MYSEKERTKQELRSAFLKIFADLPGKRIEASQEDGIGYPAFDLLDEPLIGFAAADDPIFASFRGEKIIGPSYMLPEQWLDGAKTVISFAMPFSADVRISNRGGEIPSREWLYARVEGHECINQFTKTAASFLEEQQARVCIPSRDPRFSFELRFFEENGEKNFITESTWSERHAAYACGLGTFGLSKGLITEKGMAVRFSSIITDLELPPDIRPYQRYDEYCIRCGACVRNCPSKAITLEDGKNNVICKNWVDHSRVLYAPRYGCGKCQVGVPCEGRIPAGKRKAD